MVVGRAADNAPPPYLHAFDGFIETADNGTLPKEKAIVRGFEHLFTVRERYAVLDGDKVAWFCGAPRAGSVALDGNGRLADADRFALAADGEERCKAADSGDDGAPAHDLIYRQETGRI